LKSFQAVRTARRISHHAVFVNFEKIAAGFHKFEKLKIFVDFRGWNRHHGIVYKTKLILIVHNATWSCRTKQLARWRLHVLNCHSGGILLQTSTWLNLKKASSQMTAVLAQRGQATTKQEKAFGKMMVARSFKSFKSFCHHYLAKLCHF